MYPRSPRKEEGLEVLPLPHLLMLQCTDVIYGVKLGEIRGCLVFCKIHQDPPSDYTAEGLKHMFLYAR